MRIEQLEIPAFGPFRQLSLEFAATPVDFQIIFGPNEAGKSSLLRAIRGWLFGIPSRTNDNFRVDNRQLRVGGTLRNRAGATLSFQRRKGQQKTLESRSGEPLPDSALSPFLGTVDEHYFQTMFGLGTRELQEGAEELLRGQGDLGKALFSASVGGTPIEKVLEDLRQTADRLHRPRATQNVKIRPRLLRYKELVKSSREAQTKPEAWDLAERRQRELVAAVQAAEVQRDELRAQAQWLDRLENAGALAAKFGQCQRDEDLLAQIPIVSGEFLSRVRQARDELRQRHERVQVIRQQCQRWEQELAKWPAPGPWLAAESRIKRLQGDLVLYRQRQQELPRQLAELAETEQRLQLALAEWSNSDRPLTWADLRRPLPSRALFEQAAREWLQAQRELRDCERQQQQIAGQLGAWQDQQATFAATDLTPLRELLSEIRRAGPIPARAREWELELVAARRDWESRVPPLLAGLGGGVALTAAELASLPIPSPAALHASESRYQLADQLAATCRQERQTLEKKIRDAAREIQRLEGRRALPTREELQQARELRDRGWQRVHEAWKSGGDETSWLPGIPLWEAFPAAIRRADELADQRWEDAEAVTQLETQQQTLRDWGTELEAIRQREAEAEAQREQVLREWQALWQPAGINPADPSALKTWIEPWQEFRTRFAAAEQLAQELAVCRQHIAQWTLKLRQLLPTAPVTATFFDLENLAEQTLSAHEQLIGRCRQWEEQGAQLRRDQDEMARRIERLQQAAQAPRETWGTLCRDWNLPPELDPESGLNLVERQTRLVGEYDQWQSRQRELQLAQDWCRDFIEQAQSCAADLGLVETDCEAQVVRLIGGWEESSQLAAKIHDRQLQREQAHEELQELEAQFAAAQQTFASYLHDLGDADPANLETLLTQIEQRQRLQQRKQELQEALTSLAGHLSLDDFLQRLAEENLETLAERQALNARELRASEERYLKLKEESRDIENQLQRLAEASTVAADLWQDAQLLGSEIAADTSRFCKLQFAIQLLESQIAAFRQEHQGPLLRRSGAIFQALTAGSFSGLLSQFSDDDTPVLYGQRTAPEELVPVAGMSAGTRDQLFLALRLAALENHLQHQEPQPLILDDLLITFDDQRAAAILQQLQELAGRTQVFLFTHHAHLVQLCQTTLTLPDSHYHNLLECYPRPGGQSLE